MKRLSKQQQARREALTAQITKARDDLNEVIAKFNDEVSRLHAELLAPKVEAANEVITEINAFVEEIHGEQETYYDDRSDNWRDGDAGQAYSDWMSAWDLALEELELEEPTPFDEVEINVEDFELLETEVST